MGWKGWKIRGRDGLIHKKDDLLFLWSHNLIFPLQLFSLDEIYLYKKINDQVIIFLTSIKFKSDKLAYYLS